MVYIFDSMALCYSFKFAMEKQKTQLSKEEIRTELIFLFMKYLYSIGAKDKNGYIFCWDSKKSYRKVIFPGYKDRYSELTREEKRFNMIFKKQVKTIKTEIIPELGFQNNFWQTGLEADDIIAQICKQEKPGSRIFGQRFIISRDKDLYQCLSFDASMIWKGKIFTYLDLEKQYNITAEKWGEVKAIGGCLSDTVPGVKGVGEKTAIKYINEELKSTTKAYGNIKKNGALIKRNRKLVVLPHKKTKKVKLVLDHLKWKNFESVLQRYDFKSLLTNDAQYNWQKNFYMDNF